MIISKKGLDLIKEFEGYRDKAYKCPAGVWTCGYGHTNGVKKDTACTRQEAEEWLREDVGWAERAVSNIDGLNQNQFDALVSLTYNIGGSAFKNSTVCRLAKQNPDNPAISSAIKMWNKIRVNGRLQVNKGLQNRRAKEAALYFS